MDFLARAAGGSRLAFTYVRKDFLEGKDHYDQENLYQRYVLKERIWRFGLDPQNVARSAGVGGQELAAALLEKALELAQVDVSHRRFLWLSQNIRSKNFGNSIKISRRLTERGDGVPVTPKR